jgi:hypothetical protein
MERREALVREIMQIKKFGSRLELCRVLGAETVTMLEWERNGARGFMLRLEQYLARWHPEDLAKLPHLECLNNSPWQSLVEEVLQHSNCGIVEALKPATKTWILEHLFVAPTNTTKEVSEWVLSRRASVIVAQSEKPIHPSSPLLAAFVECLKTPTRFVFFNDFSETSMNLSSLQIKYALMFLGYAQVFMVLSEFQVRGLASIVKEIQDSGTRSTRDFGMLLFGSGPDVNELATEVFYDVRGVVLAGSVPVSWVEDNGKN